MAKIAAADGDAEDLFGTVSLSDDGTTAVIGAPNDEDPNGTSDANLGGAGSAYVFSGEGGTWSQEAKLAAEDGDPEDNFGRATAVSGDGSTAVVGADRDEDPNGAGSGSAYVFSRDGETWSQESKLVAEDGDSEDRFGWSVAVSGDGSTALVGAFEDEDPNGDSGGSAYVFSREGTSWSQEAKLAAVEGNRGPLFGWSVALSGDGSTGVVGAWRDQEATGSAYVFSRDGGAWSRATRLAAVDGNRQDGLGRSVAVSSDGATVVAGADGDDDPNGVNAGSAYVFGRDGDAWSQEAKLFAEDGDGEDRFGWSVAISGDGSTAMVGAIKDEDPNGESAGSAYVFSPEDTRWTQDAKLVADDGDDGDGFLLVSVSEDGTTALVGAPGDEDPNGEGAGSAYVFQDSGADSSQTGGQTPATGTPATGESPNGSVNSTPGADGPGFGLGTALTALGGLGYLLWNRSDRLTGD